MNKRRIIALLLAAAIPTSLMTACGGDTTTTGNSSETGVVSVTESAGDAESNTSVKVDEELNITDADSLTSEQLAEYKEIIFTAVQKLDIETLKKYIGEDAETLKTLEMISENPNCKEMWDKTIGEMVYLPKSSIVVAKSPMWLYSKWCTVNADIPDISVDELYEMSNLTFDDLNEFYNEYYDECPFTWGHVGIKAYNDEDTGKVLFEIKHIFTSLGYASIAEDKWLPVRQDSDDMETSYLFYKDTGLSESLGIDGFECISDEENVPCYKELMEFDLDKFVEFVENNSSLFDSNDEYSKSFYDLYFKDETNRAVLQEWLNENCVALRTVETVQFFYKDDLSSEWSLGEDEKQILNDMNVITNKSIDHCDWVYFRVAFSEIVDKLVEEGKLPKL